MYKNNIFYFNILYKQRSEKECVQIFNYNFFSTHKVICLQSKQGLSIQLCSHYLHDYVSFDCCYFNVYKFTFFKSINIFAYFMHLFCLLFKIISFFFIYIEM